MRLFWKPPWNKAYRPVRPSPRAKSRPRPASFFPLELLEDRILLSSAVFVQDFPTPTAKSGPAHIVSGTDGNMYVTEKFAKTIARVSPNGIITELHSTTFRPDGLTMGPDGFLYFTEGGDNPTDNLVGKMRLDGSSFQEVQVNSEPTGIIVGPDSYLYFPEYFSDKIGRISTSFSLSTFSEFAVGKGPDEITLGPDGFFYFTELDADKIAKIAPGFTGFAESPALQSMSSPTGITTGADGNIWFTEAGTTTVVIDRVGVMSPSFTGLKEFSLPANSAPELITTGPDGNLYVAESGPQGQIAMVTLGGVVTQLNTPAFNKDGVAFGNDGSLWYTESGDPDTNRGNKVGKIVFDPRVSFPLSGSIFGLGAKTDMPVWQPATGTWFVRTSINGFTSTIIRQLGLPGDIPIQGMDIDGDGKADMAVWRPSTGTWYIRTSGSSYNTVQSYQWGLPGDTPIGGLTVGTGTPYVPGQTLPNSLFAQAADYTGDGKTDLAVWRPSTGTYYVLSSSDFTTQIVHPVGLPGDIPIQGSKFVRVSPTDKRADMAVWRPSTGTWIVLTASSNFTTTIVRQFGLPGDIPIQASSFDNDNLADMVVWRPSTGTWYVLTSASAFDYAAAFSRQWGQPGDVPIRSSDFDNDGKADMVVWRPSNGTWYVLTSTSTFNTAFAQQWGLPGDVPIPFSDFNGDNRADFAVWRPANSTWYVLTNGSGGGSAIARQLGTAFENSDFDGDHQADLVVWRPNDPTKGGRPAWYVQTSSSGYAAQLTGSNGIQWGLAGDIPIQGGDFDGDGKADIAVWRPSNGTWYILLSSTGFDPAQARPPIQWGLAGDIPIANSDFDGDGKADLVVWRPSNGTWYVLTSSSGFNQSFSRQFGLNGDVPLQGRDYDGDGRPDMVVWRPSNGTWYILNSGSGFTTVTTRSWGFNGDIPLQGDYTGDGLGDLVVWRPSNQTFYILTSDSGFSAAFTQQLGVAGDIPVSDSDFDKDGRADFVVWRPSNGTWNVITSSSGFKTYQWGLNGDIPL